jgi:hypothetical protein
MLRIILGVILGYVAMFVVIALCFSAMFLIGGPSFAFKGDTLNVTTGWTIGALLFALIAAAVGGIVAKLVGGLRGDTAAKALAALILILGVTLAIVHMSGPRPVPAKPVSQLTNSEAGQYAVSPTWYEFTSAILGAVAAIAGSRLVGRKTTRAELAAA